MFIGGLAIKWCYEVLVDKDDFRALEIETLLLGLFFDKEIKVWFIVQQWCRKICRVNQGMHEMVSMRFVSVHW